MRLVQKDNLFKSPQLRNYQVNRLSLLLLIFSTGIAANQSGWYPNLYPWNVTLGTYYTSGDYSSGGSYSSKAFYYSMDKRLKDRFTISIEDITITDGPVNYRQMNYFGRDNFFISSGLSIGGIIGRFQADRSLITDTTLAVNYADTGILHRQVRLDPSGWVTGLQATGEVYKLGYSLSFIHSLYQDIYAYEDEYQYETISDTTLVYAYHQEESFDQLTLTVSKQLGKHIFRGGWMTQNFSHTTYHTASGLWEWAMTKTLYSTLYFQMGKARYTVDPAILLLDNNPDILRDIVSFRTAWRATPHWTLTGVFSNHGYDSVTTEVSYHVNYWALGLQFRF
ncbi:MAG: hypothetical protein GXO91_05505 [FCB group bacterium]|nr:hypothetical protein [FCB group bacterium]